LNFQRASIAAIAYELAPIVVTSRELEARLAPLYERLRIQPGQLEALTGIRERRWWRPGQTMACGASQAASKVLAAAGLSATDLDAVIYGGVCRDNLEPASACAVAAAIGASASAHVYDVSNACLGVMNGILQVAAQIEAGRMRAGLVVSCESARQIVELTIDRMLEAGDHATFRSSLATLTGGSGAIAVLVTDRELAPAGHRLVAAEVRNHVEHHGLCRWGPDSGTPTSAPMTMETDAVKVMEHGVRLGAETWAGLLTQRPFDERKPSRLICHQVGASNRDAILAAIEMPLESDFSTFEHLGNIGTVSLPITAAIAEERGFLEPGDEVAFCGIGSGLNCLMIALQW